MHQAMNWSLVAQRTICSATQFAGDMTTQSVLAMNSVAGPEGSATSDIRLTHVKSLT